MSLTCFSAQNPNDAQRFAAQHEDKKNVFQPNENHSAEIELYFYLKKIKNHA